MSVMSNWQKLATEVIASLTSDEKEQSIVYLEQRIIPAGEELSWPGLSIGLEQASVVAFIDHEPALNWSHRACYVVLNPQGGIRRKIPAQLPPFLTEVSHHLRLIYRGKLAPEWAVVTTAVLDG